MLRGLLLLSIISYVFSVPVLPRKKISDDVLKKQLGEDGYEQLRRELTSEKFEELKKYAQLKPEEREEFKNKLKQEYEQRMHHETVFEPGSQPQLKEVWRDEDHMDVDVYSPMMIFKKHDLNGDQVLDEHEINALIEHEIEKIYPSNSTKHASLRDLETRRMRSAFFFRMDSNKDRKVTINEFLAPTQDEDDDDEWTPLEDLQEMPEFEKKTDDKAMLEFAKQQLDLHPNDPEYEEVMHMLHGVKGVPDAAHNPSDAGKSYLDVKPASGGGAAVPPPPAAPAAPPK